MTRIEGDPTPGRWLRYALGFRLPPENRDWVRHDLTDSGWRVRALVRQQVVSLPVAALFVALPSSWGVRVSLAALILFGSAFIALAYGDSLRASRLRQHGLPVPTDRDLGRPTDSS